MKYLVVVADDFGFTDGINKGCLEANRNGILTEMSLMLDSPATQASIDQILKNNIHGLGLHITLNDIVGTGNYMRTPDYIELLEKAPEAELIQRVNYELETFEKLTGRIPTHINGHHNCHLHPRLVSTISDYALKHQIYIRRPRNFTDGKSAGVDVTDLLIEKKVKLTDYIFEHIAGSYDDAFNGFIEDLSTVEDNTVTEIFFHPAYVDDTLRKYSSLLEDRERDLKLLQDKAFIDKIKELNFEVVGFSQV